MNSVLERVNAVCCAVRDSNKTPISFKKLVGQTRKTFKDNGLDLVIKTKKENTLDNSEFYVMAYYDADDDFNGETPIEVVVHHKFQDIDLFSQQQITDFLIQIYDAVVHECRHQQQSYKRSYRTFHSNHNYLRDLDEVDAYAFSVAIELIRAIGVYRAKRNLPRLSLLAKMRQGTMLVSPNLKSYMLHFGLTSTTKRLAKKVSKHLDILDTRHIFK